MTKPILYYLIESPPVRTVLLTARHIGLDLELRRVDLFNLEHQSPEFTKLNIQQTVPLLIDEGDKIIYDSHAISTYLIGKYGKDDSLYPVDLYERSKIDQRLHFDSGILFPRLRNCMYYVLFEGAFSYSEEKLELIYIAYDFLNKFLEKSSYVVGDQLTLADFACATTVTQLYLITPIDYQKYPNIRKWLDRLSEIPYFVEINTKTVDDFKVKYDQIFLENKKKAEVGEKIQ